MSYRSQAVASVLLGTPLSFAVCGLYAQFGPADPATDFLVGMCLLLPVWCAILMWGLKRERGSSAWAGLSAGCVVVGAIVLISRYLIGA